MEDNYEDIINLEHYEPQHPRMSRYNRAAQFAPFAALTGYNELVLETARITSDKVIISNEEKMIINDRLNIIKSNIKNSPEIELTYFIKDEKKKGGKYLTITSKVKKINEIENYILLSNNIKINIKDILKIEIKKS